MTGVAIFAIPACLAAARLPLRLDVRDFLPTSAGGAPDVDRGGAQGGLIAIVLESDSAIPSDVAATVFSSLRGPLESLAGVATVRTGLTPGERRFLEEILPRRILLYLDPADVEAASARLSRSGIDAALTATAGAPDSTPAVERLRLARDPLGVAGPVARATQSWPGTSKVRLTDGNFSSVDGRAFFMTVESETGLSDVVSAREMVQAIEGVLEAASADPAVGPLIAGLRLYPAGRPVSFVAAFDTLAGDVSRVAVGGALVVCVLLGLFFRSILAPIAILTAVALGLVSTAATVSITTGSASLMAWIFVGLMIGLGVDFGVHISAHYCTAQSSGHDRGMAVSRALSRPGSALILGALTSASAFLCLLIVPYPATREVAWITALGLLMILACSFVLVPLVLSFRAPGDAPAPRRVTRLVSAGRGGGSFGVLSWTLLTLAAALLIPSTRFEAHPWRLAVRGNPESATLDRLSDLFGSGFTPLQVVSTGATPEEAIERDRMAVERLDAVALRAGVAQIESLSRWLPARDRQARIIALIRRDPDLFSPTRFERDFRDAVSSLTDVDPALTNEYMPLIRASLDPEIEALTLDGLRSLGLEVEVGRFISSEGDEHRVVSNVYLSGFPWAQGVVPRFMDGVERSALLEIPGVSLRGDALLSAGHVPVIRRAVLLATALAALLVGMILWARFRRLSLVGLCLLPLVCGLCVSFLVLRALGIELTLLSIAVAPMLVGIGVDDGIHVVDRLARGESIEAALRETGPGIVMTTLTTAGAMACLALATFTGIREVGVVGAAGLLACLAATLHLVPTCWRLVDGRARGSEPGGSGPGGTAERRAE